MRTIIVKIETDSETPLNLIKQDIEQELSCCWNWFDSVKVSEQPEIIQCKECKYHTDEEPGAVYCPDRVGGWVDEDFFCKDGDRSIEDGCAVIPGSGSDK